MGDRRKTILLLYYLGNEASNTTIHLNIIDTTNYYDAKEALMKHFSPVETPEKLCTKFHLQIQYNEETREHFAIKLRVLCSSAYKSIGPEKLEDMAKQQFIIGVQK